QTKDEYALIAEQEAGLVGQIEAILAKKNEGRPVTPEEYTTLGQFVDRVERGIIQRHQVEQKMERERRDTALAAIHELAFETHLENFNLSKRVLSILMDAEIFTVGDLMLQMELDSDTILALNGIGPKAMQDIETALNELTFPEVVEEVEPEEEAEIEGEQEAEISEEVVEVGESLEPQVEVQAEPEAVMEDTAEVIAEEEAQAEEISEIEVEAEEEEMATIVEEEEEEEEEMPASLDEIFALKPEVFEAIPTDDEEEEEEEGSRKKKKKKKKKYVEMEYDPDKDVVVVKRKRKRGGVEDWDDDWEY
ncbi:MAG: hypothetical protein ACNA8H_11955, partial [Anaerolineales bacterium]